MITKKCSQCKTEKSLVEFYRNNASKCGLCCACKDCMDAKRRLRFKMNPGLSETYRKKMNSEHPGYHNLATKAWRKRNDLACKLMAIKSVAKRKDYSPCTATADELQNSLTGKCAICGVPESECSQTLHLDHDHETGKFRGWLCGPCNRLLGLAKDNREILLLAGMYLEQSCLRGG